uniref:CWF19 like cell cycle control factor 2 n=1 Tax=Eptatretus burgeri TaxID=7764 RepID=A0A8C4R4H7_EPTBU
GSKPKKKSKKEKTKKKKKKKVTLKHQTKGSVSSSHSSSRDEWMNLDFLTLKSVSLAGIQAEKQKVRDEEREKKDVLEQPGVHERELNPYWKSGGTGLPPAHAEALAGNSRVGDCGVSWLHRSYQRMKERAQNEGRHLDSIIEERYGVRALGYDSFRIVKMHDVLECFVQYNIKVSGEKNGDGCQRRGARGPTDEWRNQQRQKDQRRTFGDTSSRAGERNGNKGWRRGWRKPGNEERSDFKRALKEREDIEHQDLPKIRNSTEHWLNPSSLPKCSFLKPSDDDYDFGIGTKEKSSLASTKPKSCSLRSQQDDSTKACTEARCESDELPTTACLDKDAAKVDPLPQVHAYTRRHQGACVKTHVDGKRIRYFDDDDNYSLQDLVRREHMSTAEDQNYAFSHLFTKVREHTDREHYTLDDMFVSAAGGAGRSADEEMQQCRRAAAEQRKLAGLMANCGLCFDSPELRKHLVVAVGSKVFMSLPNHQSLVEGHCIIAPLQHFTAGNALDEDVWAEMQTFRKALVQMFSQDNKDCVFLEICTNSKRRYHMKYECVPLDHDLGNLAPMYFKKAIQECDEEWSMNKKLVDLSQQDIRRVVPKGLPYFSVDFGLQGGFAHIIEDKQKFPHYFGKEVLGGMLDAEPRLWRKPPREGFEEQRRKVLRFAQMWKSFDFTRSKC